MGGYGRWLGGYLLPGTGILASILALAVPGQAPAVLAALSLVTLAPFQSQDRARVFPSFHSVRVDIHAWGGSA